MRTEDLIRETQEAGEKERASLANDWKWIKRASYAGLLWCAIGVAVGMWSSVKQSSLSESRHTATLERIATALERMADR